MDRTTFVGTAAAAPLTFRRFRWLWSATQLHNIGHLLYGASAAWVVLDLTGSAIWVGLVTAAPAMAVPVFSLVAGALADRVHRGRIQLAAVLLVTVSVVTTWVLAWGGYLEAEMLLGLTLLLGVGSAFYGPAWQASVTDLVPDERVSDAVALNAAGPAAAQAVGPALGGVLLAVAGASWTFGTSIVAVSLTLATIATVRRGSANDATGPSVARAMRLGLRHVWFGSGYRWVVVVAASFAVAAASLRALLPSLTSDVLRGGAGMYGLLLGAFGVGAVIGVVSRKRADRMLGRFMSALSIGLFGAVGVGASTIRSAVAVALLLVVAGIAWTWTLSTLNAIAISLSPQWVRARVVSVFVMVFATFLSLGSVAAGVVADATTPSAALAGFSIAVLWVGGLAVMLPGRALGTIRTPQTAGLPSPPAPSDTGEGEVLVVTTWHVGEDDLEDFLPQLEQLRLIRMRTGASSWAAYRDADSRGTIMEVMTFHDWGDYDRLVRRLDVQSVRSIKRAWRMDDDEHPSQMRLLRIDKEVHQGALDE